MDFLFAKIRGRGGSFCKVISDQTVYNDIPDFTNSRGYNDEVKLQDNEWFVVEHFATKDYAPQIVKDVFNAAAWSQIVREHYAKIDYLVSVQNDHNLFLFQNITTSAVLKRQSFVSMDDQPSLLNKDHLVVIHEKPDAYYVKVTDKLYFKRLSTITSIFPGINELYNEATDDEVDRTLQLDILNVSAEFTRDNVKTANRRKIREAMDAYENFSEAQKQALPGYFQKYCPNLFADGKVNIEDEKSLTLFLNGINQRFYTTEITTQQRVALSVDNL